MPEFMPNTELKRALRRHIGETHVDADGGAAFSRCLDAECSEFPAETRRTYWRSVVLNLHSTNRDEIARYLAARPGDAYASPVVNDSPVRAALLVHRTAEHVGGYRFPECPNRPCVMFASQIRAEVEHDCDNEGEIPLMPDFAEARATPLDVGNLPLLLEAVERIAAANVAAHRRIDRTINEHNEAVGTTNRNEATIQRDIEALHGELHDAMSSVVNERSGDRARTGRIDKTLHELGQFAERINSRLGSIESVDSDVAELRAAVQPVIDLMRERTAYAGEIDGPDAALPLQFEDAAAIGEAVYGRLRIADALTSSEHDDEGWNWQRAQHHVSVAAVLAEMYGEANWLAEMAADRAEREFEREQAADPFAGIRSSYRQPEYGPEPDKKIRLRDINTYADPATGSVHVSGTVPAEFADIVKPDLSHLSIGVQGVAGFAARAARNEEVQRRLSVGDLTLPEYDATRGASVKPAGLIEEIDPARSWISVSSGRPEADQSAAFVAGVDMAGPIDDAVIVIMPNVRPLTAADLDEIEAAEDSDELDDDERAAAIAAKLAEDAEDADRDAEREFSENADDADELYDGSADITDADERDDI